MKEQLIHILDQSVCLSRKQMKEYLSGSMPPEEMHAIEIHLNSCPLCNVAMEGFEEHSDAALEAIASLNSGFLKDHFANISPQIHLNSMAPAAAMPASSTSRNKSGRIQPIWKTASIAAAALLAFGTLWYMEFGRNNKTSSSRIAMADEKALSATPAIPQYSEALNTQKQADISKTPAHTTTNATAASEKKSKSKDQLVPTESRDASEAGVALDESTTTPAMGNAAPAAAPPVAAEPKKQLSEVTVASRAFKAPLVTPPASGNLNYSTPENNDKSAGRKMTDVAALNTQVTTNGNGLSLGGGRNSGTKYVIDGVQMKPGTAKFREARSEPGTLELGDASFEDGKYSTALQHYKKAMNSGSPKERDQAAIMAARCYAALGNKAKAQELLHKVMDEASGPERRAARRALRSLE